MIRFADVKLACCFYDTNVNPEKTLQSEVKTPKASPKPEVNLFRASNSNDFNKNLAYGQESLQAIMTGISQEEDKLRIL